MQKTRLDLELANRGLVQTRSQAESYIKLGKVKVDGKIITKAGYLVGPGADVIFAQDEQYVSRAALKLASVADALGIDFDGKVVMDVGSSTGGFTDYALKNGAAKVIAIDVGTQQMHPSIRKDERVELHEKTDIRNFAKPAEHIDIILIDVSFISIRNVLPTIAVFTDKDTQIIAMLKPQFEAGVKDLNKGVVKNDSLRRRILNGFEDWAKKMFIIEDKADSKVAGTKGNQERFYLLKTKS